MTTVLRLSSRGVAVRELQMLLNAADSSLGLDVDGKFGGDTDEAVSDDHYGPAGTELINPNANITAVPTREMRQCGTIAHTTTAATSNFSAAGVYRYKYSRPPKGFTMDVGLASGSAQSTVAGQFAFIKT